VYLCIIITKLSAEMTNISKVFREHGLSISEVARRMGITKGTLSNAISHGNMRISTLERMATAVGCRVVDFFETDEAPKEEPKNPAVTAFVDFGGKMYREDSLEGLERLVEALKAELEVS